MNFNLTDLEERVHADWMRCGSRIRNDARADEHAVGHDCAVCYSVPVAGRGSVEEMGTTGNMLTAVLP
jgi:hypothetical protein